MIIDGKKIAQVVRDTLSLQGKTLGILIVGSDPVTDSFVRAKEKVAHALGVAVVREVLEQTTETETVLSALSLLARTTDGIIVQLPLPSHIDTEQVLAALPPEKDVDGISLRATVRPPVAAAVEEILRFEKIEVRGKKAVVVGAGRLVGKPCAKLLEDLGAQVTVLTKSDSLETLHDADIVVLGAGQPGFVRPEHLKKGVVLIDAGTSESSGKVVGDADPLCANVASVFTPVPGGVGPIAVAMIFKNLLMLGARQATVRS